MFRELEKIIFKDEKCIKIKSFKLYKIKREKNSQLLIENILVADEDRTKKSIFIWLFSCIFAIY